MNAAIPDTPLVPVIRQQILTSSMEGTTNDGRRLSAIPFHHYMTLCLYHPDFGYYRSGTSRVGREGDFYTSAYVGELMGEQLASELSRMAKSWFPEHRNFRVFDWGGGTGRLSKQMLDAWGEENRTSIPERSRAAEFALTVVDGNPEHRRQASEILAPYAEAGVARVIGEEDGDEEILSTSIGGDPIFVLGNELLDAFPVHRVIRREGRLREWGVTWREEQGFIPCLLDTANPRLEEWTEKYGANPAEGQTFEICLDAADWVHKVAERVDRGMLVFIDYGDETEELLSPHRMDGTLLCYREHRAHNDPYAFPGEQDMTAHVNFSHIRRIAERSGWEERWYGTQKKFLVESGILGKLSAHAETDPFHPVVRRNRAIRQLLLSDGMSELFKVQILIK
ncbi:class I SAM-dependent methyltransferase [Cohnella endophytica]|nr:SAM-dependent methyltransferase [Cohnella endophytica]